jgi:hypothetical protein
MSTEPVTEQEVEKLREWVDDLRIPKPVEAPKSPAVHDPKPQVHVLKASAEISVGAKRSSARTSRRISISTRPMRT